MEDTNEGGRGFRQRKKPVDAVYCPICEITIKPSEIEQHYELEVDRLIKLQINQKVKKNITNGNSGYHEPVAGCSSNGNDETNGCPWVTFQKIRNNRHLRLRIKNRKRKLDDPICPICNERPTDDINLHVEMCLKKSENDKKPNGNNNNDQSDDDEECIDIEGESFEEYEWAGQKRVRASTFLEGGYAAAGVGTTINNEVDEDDEEDLNVDGDDTQIFGPSQYSERNVIVPLSGDCEKEINENMYLRQLVTGQDVNQQLHDNNSSNNMIPNEKLFNPSIEHDNHVYSSQKTIKSEIGQQQNVSEPKLYNGGIEHVNQILESLKAKLRDYETKISNKCKCLICMDEFHNPAVSICCWHVHCEECWLRTLGARKLCPQCNMITSPNDLRRIYM